MRAAAHATISQKLILAEEQDDEIYPEEEQLAIPTRPWLTLPPGNGEESLDKWPTFVEIHPPERGRRQVPGYENDKTRSSSSDPDPDPNSVVV